MTQGKTLAIVGATLAAVAAMVTIADSEVVAGVSWWIFETITQLALGLWTRGALIFLILVMSSLAGWILLGHGSLTVWWREGLGGLSRTTGRIGVLALLLVILTFALVRTMYFDMLPAPEGPLLFPQVASLGPVATRTWATNGRANYMYIYEPDTSGPEHGYGKIVFQAFGKTAEENSGWTLITVRGLDLDQFQTLRFQVRGERGDERIGIKAKDARGVEVALMLAPLYLRDGAITSRWQEVAVPLDDFANVEFGLIENFTLYTTGELSGTRRQTVFVGDFRLTK